MDMYSDCHGAKVIVDTIPNTAAENGVTIMYECTQCHKACTAHEGPPVKGPLEFKDVQPEHYDRATTNLTKEGAVVQKSQLTGIPSLAMQQNLIVMFEISPLSDRYQQLMLTEKESTALNGFLKAVL